MSIIYNQKGMMVSIIQRLRQMKEILYANGISYTELIVDPSTDYVITSYLKSIPSNKLRIEYPQVVVNGQLIGGLKNLEEAQQDGRLQALLKKVVDEDVKEVLKVLSSSISSIKKEHAIQIAEIQAESNRSKRNEEEQQKLISKQSNIISDHAEKEKQKLAELEIARKLAAEKAKIEADRRLNEVDLRYNLLRSQQPSAADLKAKEEREFSILVDETTNLLSSLTPAQKDDLEMLAPMFPNLFRKTLLDIRRRLPNATLEAIIDHIFANTNSIEANQPSFPILLANIDPFQLESGKYASAVDVQPENDNKIELQKVAQLTEENDRLARENEKLRNESISANLDQEKILTIMRLHLLTSIDQQEAQLAELQKLVIQTSAQIATQRANLAQVDASLATLASK